MIVDVGYLENRIRRQLGTYHRTTRYRVEVDDPFEEALRVLAAPFVDASQWNVTPIVFPVVIPFTWGINETSYPVKPEGGRVFTDNNTVLIDCTAYPENPIDNPDGHGLFWIVEGVWRDPRSDNVTFNQQEEFNPTFTQ